MIETLKDYWWLACTLLGVLAYCVHVGYRVRELMARIERLERPAPRGLEESVPSVDNNSKA